MRLTPAALLLAMTLAATANGEESPAVSVHNPDDLFNVYCWRAGQLVQTYEYVRLFVSRRSFLSIIDDQGNHSHFAALQNTQCEIVLIEEEVS
jgi:hypothetical protein